LEILNILPKRQPFIQILTAWIIFTSMNFYQFDNEGMDRRFLLREIVKCTAILPKSSLISLQPGDKIVIQLSNGSKYMGTIRDFNFTMIDDIGHGYIEVIRH
jgi:hypothetical protein